MFGAINKTLLRKFVFTNPCGQAKNLLHKRLFDTGVETLLKTFLELGKCPVLSLQLAGSVGMCFIYRPRAKLDARLPTLAYHCYLGLLLH
jgi:hypothetical protein